MRLFCIEMVHMHIKCIKPLQPSSSLSISRVQIIMKTKSREVSCKFTHKKVCNIRQDFFARLTSGLNAGKKDKKKMVKIKRGRAKEERNRDLEGEGEFCCTVFLERLVLTYICSAILHCFQSTWFWLRNY